MFKFFRKIRHKLLSENKLSKYLFYAFGEIILVVIGILIALQINNWNENRKNKQYEITMLSQLQEQLKLDYEMVNQWIPSLNDILHSINEVAAIKEDPTYPTDSLQHHINAIKGFGIAISFNTSAYDAINSGGLDKISDVKIRNLISDVYGNSIPSTSNWINEIVRVSLFERNELFYQIYSPVVVPGPNGVIQTKLIVQDAEALRDNPKADEMLEILNWPIPITIRIMENLSQKMEKLITELDNHL